MIYLNFSFLMPLFTIGYESDRNDSQTYFKPRTRLLLPNFDLSGRPRCLTVPNDTFCESVANYPL
jgi:hypothetical protein